MLLRLLLVEIKVFLVCCSFVPPDVPPSLASNRRMLVLGDSYTVGYGDAGKFSSDLTTAACNLHLMGWGGVEWRGLCQSSASEMFDKRVRKHVSLVCIERCIMTSGASLSTNISLERYLKIYPQARNGL